jgi:hypothetical protein
MIQIILAVLMTIGVYSTPAQITITSDTKTASGETVTFYDSGNSTNYTMTGTATTTATGGTEEIGWGITSK